MRKDLAQAAELYQEAADQEDADGQYRLGACYEKGAGGRRDLAKARALYQLAAEQNHRKAKEALKKLKKPGLLGGLLGRK